MEELLTVFGPARMLGVEQILMAFLMSFVLSSLLATVYRWTFQGFSYSRAFVHTMILGAMIVCLLIMAIGNNLARGLGILGTLAVIRFRTHIRDPRDMIFLFAALATGIACGANTFDVAILGAILISVAALLLHWSPFASRRSYDGMLRFVSPANHDFRSALEAMMQRFCSNFFLVAVRETTQGEQLEYSYQVRLRDPSYRDDLIEGVRTIEGLRDMNDSVRDAELALEEKCAALRRDRARLEALQTEETRRLQLWERRLLNATDVQALRPEVAALEAIIDGSRELIQRREQQLSALEAQRADLYRWLEIDDDGSYAARYVSRNSTRPAEHPNRGRPCMERPFRVPAGAGSWYELVLHVVYGVCRCRHQRDHGFERLDDRR